MNKKDRCKNCPAFWETNYPDGSDYGCKLEKENVEYNGCWLPKFIIKIKLFFLRRSENEYWESVMASGLTFKEKEDVIDGLREMESELEESELEESEETE